MPTIIDIVQIVIAILMVVVILLQQQGSGLSDVFGGGGSTYHSRRGMEKVLFVFTIALAVLFVVVAILRIFLKV